MEEEVGIKVTRLRRRLSVESDDVKSPSTQSTPTKKRGGRLAAKPQLELIDENATEAPKKTRKSTVKDLEPVEEKAVTPSRRTTRTRSNTSIVSETPAEGTEEKGTPSRRSTRIKSNTSIVAEATQIVNSPRAKRAARRTSQVGSDNETPVTPAKQTRRTRKDSTSSVDKPAEPNGSKLSTHIDDVIAEEAENNVKEINSTTSPKNDSPTHRKSPRLIEKSGRKSSSFDIDKDNKPQSDKTSEINNDTDKTVSEIKSNITNKIVEQCTPEKSNLSVSSSNLIKDLAVKSINGKNIMNKSTSAVEEPQIKSKRNRTKSWTTISMEPSNESSFCSDNEASKKKHKQKTNSLNFLNISGSGDGIMNTSNKESKENVNIKEISLNSPRSDKKKKKRHDKSVVNTEIPVHEVLNTSVKRNKYAGKDENEEVDLNVSQKQESSVAQKLFEQAPSGLIQSLVYMEDSDSNSSNVKGNNDKVPDSGDQCVPVIDHTLGIDETSKESKTNVSYEPMDIDETMPGNISLSTFTEKDNYSNNLDSDLKGLGQGKSNISQVKDDSINKSERNSTFLHSGLDNSMNEGPNKSQNKSSTTQMDEDSIHNVSNISVGKSCGSSVVPEDTVDAISNMADRKALVIDLGTDCEQDKKYTPNTEGNIDNNSNKSIRNIVMPDAVQDTSMNKNTNKTQRKSSICNVNLESSINEKISNNSVRKSSIPNLNDEENINKKIYNCNRKSSISTMVDEVSVNKTKSSISISDKNIEDNITKSSKKSKRNESLSTITNDDSMNKSSNKSKRKASLSTIANDDSMDKTSNKSINKSSMSPMLPHTLDKTENGNKSTLVLSQIKDVSVCVSEKNMQKDSNDLNEQLSKSVNMPSVNREKDSDKRNLSLTYSTSTPLHQKSIKKLAMQMNSSIITPHSVSKIEKMDSPNKSKKEASILLQENDSDSSEEEEDDDEESLERNKLIIDEAEEANENYESGDSRDEDEKEYEVENEIIEKGETLESDENEDSDDSDYEKDSFIVSSDEEDIDLLSGSGDDLSMSADELSMSTKSKTKYNERKSKEQKRASREMFEARHKLNKINKSEQSNKSTTKKNKRLQLDSSSEDEKVTVQPKKNRRQRINSTQDISVEQNDVTDMSSTKKKKKAKRLSDSSLSEGNPLNEKKITIREYNVADRIDPLNLQNVVKEEPKTPQKNLNISTVAFTNIEEVEEVMVSENLSMVNSNQTSDPLQTTIDQDGEINDDSEDLTSENEEITQNYESVLSNLSKSNPKKVKKEDISLNLNKKPKKKGNDPIVDQLNLTHVKAKNKEADIIEKAATPKKMDGSLSQSKETSGKQVNIFSEGSSDSIDMKLLFSEDSNDNEAKVIKNSNTYQKITNNTIQKKDVQDAPENFIPLKRTVGKTNMLENMETSNTSKDESVLNVSSKKKKNKHKLSITEQTGTMETSNTSKDESVLNVSSKKKKNKHKLSITEQTGTIGTQENEHVSFFIDTTGTHEDTNKTETDANTSIMNSGKKKQKNNVPFNIEKAKVDDEDSNDAPLEVSYRSEKNKSKQDLNTTQNKAESQVNTLFESQGQSGKKKKKNKKGLNSSQDVTEFSVIENKKNESPGTIHNISLGSSKEHKQKPITESFVVEKENVNKDVKDVTYEEEISKKRKRKSSANQTIDEILATKDDLTLNTSKTDDSLSTNNTKKKRKVSHNDKDVEAQVQDSVNETQGQEKAHVKNAKKKIKVLQHQEVDEINDEITKKNKKRKERDDDDANKVSKVLKQNSFDQIYVPRLSANVLKELDDKPLKDIGDARKSKVISTTSFMVEEARKRKNKPSNYLEESVYLNDDLEDRRQKSSIRNPKVLPFIPTASTSDNGFTTKFCVNVIPQQTQFVAQSNDKYNFKDDYLNKKRIKKLGTFEMYKRQRSVKISKF